jgi:hypothetical protein
MMAQREDEAEQLSRDRFTYVTDHSTPDNAGWATALTDLFVLMRTTANLPECWKLAKTILAPAFAAGKPELLELLKQVPS